ncbi:MAG: xanthine dehydrogenase family protein molybdopterin-binding subunit [Acidobacteriia bacterium]|nr:xanthine dehydrogenase family protein molybdopterin-binding subunit [Terriglobia bacterium]
MADYKWPDAQHRTLIGTRQTRVDGPVKVSGRAKYTYDQNPKGLLAGAILRSPHAHAKVVSVDTSAAERMPGVKAVQVLQGDGKEIRWAGDEIVALAAIDERTAEDALRAIKVQYNVLPHFVDDTTEPKDAAEETGPLALDDLVNMFSNQVPEPQIAATVQKRGLSFPVADDLVKRMRSFNVGENVIKALQSAPQKPPETTRSPFKKSAANVTGNPDQAFQSAEVTSTGLYGVPVITHCCLEAHGVVAHWPDAEHLETQVSTQSVSDMPNQIAGALAGAGIQIPASNIRNQQQHVGGGFGSKFAADRWSLAAAQLSKKAGGAPVKIMLDRRAELEVAGARPSAHARVKLAAKKDGAITAWDSQSWGTGGPLGGNMPPIPYIFTEIPNQRKQHISIATNIGPARAWRAPNHPQAAVLTMCAIDDLAARLGMDPFDVFLKNLALTPRANVYEAELKKADELMQWKKRWHPRGDKTSGPMKQGLGLSIHTWGGRGHQGAGDLTIHPDGTVEYRSGTQDLGTGTRTAIAMVIGETLGLPLDAITVKIGDTNFPHDGGSGGSTTIGAVSAESRRAATDALNELLAKVAPTLGVPPDQLEALYGTIRVKDSQGKSVTWKKACSMLGATGVTAHGKNPDPSKPPDLTNSGVGGAQMADVSVDVETGIVRINKMVAVQDCGLVINLKTAESQCYGAMIMGISYALFEEKIMDPTTGRMLNPNLQFYRLAGYGDIPELVVHMMTGPGYDERGVIGLGEPPVISPGAAISNAVANAIGVRVPFLPITPDRVLAALEKKGGAA